MPKRDVRHKTRTVEHRNSKYEVLSALGLNVTPFDIHGGGDEFLAAQDPDIFCGKLGTGGVILFDTREKCSPIN